MPRPKSLMALLSDIVDDDVRFTHRSGGLSHTHCDTLLRSLTDRVNIDPMWVWDEVDSDGNQTGKLILMDGRHRLSAYKAKAKFNARKGRKPQMRTKVFVFEGTETMAALKALELNSKDKLSLTHMEKLDAAWAIVKRDTEGEATKPMISTAAGISQRTVLNMRNKRKAIINAGDILPDTWTKARHWPAEADWTPPTDEERKALVAEVALALQCVLRDKRCRDVEVIGDAIATALGNPQLEYVVDYLRKRRDPDFDEFRSEEYTSGSEF